MAGCREASSFKSSRARNVSNCCSKHAALCVRIRESSGTLLLPAFQSTRFCVSTSRRRVASRRGLSKARKLTRYRASVPKSVSGKTSIAAAVGRLSCLQFEVQAYIHNSHVTIVCHVLHTQHLASNESRGYNVSV